jgi:hypothetical protein
VVTPLPVCLERGRLITAAKVWHVSLESGGGALPTQTVNKQAGQTRHVWHYLPPSAWREEGFQWQLKCGTFQWRLGEEHIPTRTLNNKKRLQIQQAGRAVYEGNKRGMHPGEL